MLERLRHYTGRLTISSLNRLRSWSRRLFGALNGGIWFPHVPLAIAMLLGGYGLLQLEFAGRWQQYAEALAHGEFNLPASLLPPLLIGGGMLIMAFGLLARSRLAWTMATLLAITGGVSLLFGRQGQPPPLLGYFVLMVVCLTDRRFNRMRPSIAPRKRHQAG